MKSPLLKKPTLTGVGAVSSAWTANADPPGRSTEKLSAMLSRRAVLP
jgi:hypothetical protein